MCAHRRHVSRLDEAQSTCHDARVERLSRHATGKGNGQPEVRQEEKEVAEVPEVLGNEDVLIMERQQQLSEERQALLEKEKEDQISCSLDNPDACEACGS